MALQAWTHSLIGQDAADVAMGMLSLSCTSPLAMVAMCVAGCARTLLEVLPEVLPPPVSISKAWADRERYDPAILQREAGSAAGA